MEEKEKLNLEEWFKNLDVTWKRIFKQEIDINRNPTLIDIENIINLENVDCSKSYIISLDPLKCFKRLKKLDISNTKIKRLDKIRGCLSLEEINASNTEIKDITPLQNLVNLKKLDVSNTKVSSIEEVSGIIELIYFNTPVEQKAKDAENEIVLDSLFLSAVDLVVISQQGSVSSIQRKFNVGFSRAARIIDQLEEVGIVGQFQKSKARHVLYQDIDSVNTHLASLNIPIIINSEYTVNTEKKIKKSFWKRLFF